MNGHAKSLSAAAESIVSLDTSRFDKALARVGRAAARFAADAARLDMVVRRRPVPKHIPRTSGVGPRQVLRPWLGKAIRHPWAHERDANGRLIPLVEGGGPLPTRKVTA